MIAAIKQSVERLYHRYERYVPLVSFLGGFLWDSLTLTRIDRLSDNVILLVYLVLSGVAILFIHLIDQHRITHPQVLRFREWYPVGLQFFLGGLFSSYVVFYFQSVSMTQTAVFFVLLVVLLVANEFLEDRLDNVYLQFTLFTLSAFSFFIFFIPIVIKRMTWWTVVLAIIFTAIFVGKFIYLLWRFGGLPSRQTVGRVAGISGGVLALLILFYVLNWIPPVPLSLKYGGVYHHVHRENNVYVLQYHAPPWYKFWVHYDKTFYYQPGDTVFCFTAVFAPTLLNTKIVHHWQVYSEKEGRWLTTDQRHFQLFGGREKGYRGYTYKRNVRPGQWRVDVENQLGQVLGRISFRIVPADSQPRRMKTVYYE